MKELTFDANERYALAFSGGVDSSYLLNFMLDDGADVKAYLVDTPFTPREDIQDALRIAKRAGAVCEVVDVDMRTHDKVCANPPDRCYHCKKIIFGAIRDAMASDGRSVLIDGTNASDDPAGRPGFKALHEMDVHSPLRDAGLTKDDIRTRSRALGLPSAAKASFACLSVHVDEGARIDEESLDAAQRRLSGFERYPEELADELGIPRTAITLDLSTDATRQHILELLTDMLDEKLEAQWDLIMRSATLGNDHYHDIGAVNKAVKAGVSDARIVHDTLSIYRILANAEASVHGVPVEKTHFHEVGHADAVRNIVGICAALSLIDPGRIVSTPAQTGKGKVECAHGLLDIPAPATAAIIAEGIEVSPVRLDGELMTPTSAAVILHFVDGYTS